MKLRHLHINNFGHFSEHDIPLPGDGLQVIYGPNEAGKTTLLEFLRGWLFDFPVRTPYDFKGGAEVAGVGTLALADGRLVELRRRKGNKNKVAVKIDGHDTDLDEVGFQRLLGNANRNLYESVFAFGLDQLAQGEESLKHESLQSALFGGGLGHSASPEDILRTLDEGAARLFSPSARGKSAINSTLSDLKALASEIKQKNLQPQEYSQRKEAVKVSDADAQRAHQQVDELRRAHSRLDRLHRAWPKWHELQQKKQERLPLSAPAELPANARQQFESSKERLREANVELSRLDEMIARTQESLAKLRLDPHTLSFQAEIRVCLELKQSYVEARRDLPERIQQRDATRQEIDRELNELRPGWGPGDLRAFAIDVATRAELDRLVNDDHERTKELAKLQAARDGIESNLADARAELDILGDSTDVSALAAVLADEADYVSSTSQRDAQTRELAKINRQLDTRCRKLTPPLAAGSESPHELPVPRVETIARFEVEFAEGRDLLRAAINALEGDEAELLRLAEQQGDSRDQRAVPSLEQRADAQRRRDAGWRLIRARYVAGQPEPTDEQAWLNGNSGDLVGAYEQSIREADDVADRIYENAEAVAQRESRRRQSETIANRIAQKQTRVAELRAAGEDLREQWGAIWQPCGFEPLAPEAMRRWFDDHAAVCETLEKRAECEAELRRCAERIALFEARLTSAHGSAEIQIDALLATARQSVERATDQQRESKRLLSRIKKLEVQLATSVDKLASLEDGQAAWNLQWRSLLSRLNLPTEWTTDLARSVIERLVATRVKLDSLPHEESRIASMQERVQDFEARVLPLCKELAPELVGAPPELVVEKMSDQSARAIKTQTDHDRLHEQLSSSQDHRRQVATRIENLNLERRSLLGMAGVEDEAAFFDVVNRAERIKQLDDELQRLDRDIDLIRATDERTEFEQELGQVEPGVLEGRQRDASEALQRFEQEVRGADGAAAVAKRELARLDGSSAVVELVDQQSRKRAQLVADIDRYVPLVLAKHLLNEAIRRFERENQPAMIAAVSRLFCHMTAGRYTEFDRTGGEHKGILVRRNDGAERTPDQLSAGTREQLYLAIRLAYVQHYCQQNEPLPIIMDDVLVNFDDDRARQTLAALTSVASHVQVLFFTCHPHMVALAREVSPSLTPIELPAVS